MDILYWKALYSNIAIESTAKQFYKKYCYRLELSVPGCKSIFADDIREDLNNRIDHCRTYRYSGSWWNFRLKAHLDRADVNWLLFVKQLIVAFPEIKTRFEEPKISFYSNDEESLKSLVEQIVIKKETNKLLSISGPADNTAKELLIENKIIVKKQPAWRFKVWLRETHIDIASRLQVRDYLQNLGDLVKLPAHTVEQLTKPSGWIWNSYFYTNDSGVVDFVKLIHPDIIREVCEQVCLTTK